MYMEKPVISLQNKVCFITGGAGLLGSATAKAMAIAGATVLLVDIDSKKGETVAKTIRKDTGNDQVYFYTCDSTSEKAVQKLLAEIIKNHKHIDALVNNAYPRNKNYGRKFENVTYADFCENLSMNVGSYFLMAKEVSAVMKRTKSGSIVNIGSIYGTTAPDFSIYSGTDMTMPVEYAAIKGGVTNLTKYLASYLGPNNIRVNTVSPGGIANNQAKSFVKKYSAKVRLGNRMAAPNDIVGAIIFLLSDASEYITGQNIVVDGGWTL